MMLFTVEIFARTRPFAIRYFIRSGFFLIICMYMSAKHHIHLDVLGQIKNFIFHH